MVEEHQLSERRACSLVGLSRDSYRNPPQPDQLTRDLGERIVDIAHVRRRFGYRRIHDLAALRVSWGEPQTCLPALQECQPGGAPPQES